MPAIKEFQLFCDDLAHPAATFRAAWDAAGEGEGPASYGYRRNIVDNAMDGFSQNAFAGIAEYWSGEAASDLPLRKPPAIEGLALARSVHFLAEEFIIKEGRGAVKFMSILRRKPGATPQDFSAAWRMKHPLVVRSVPEVWERFRGYRQNHILPDLCRHLDGNAMQRPYDGIVEIWFDSLDDLRATMMSDRYREIIRPDEETFVDLPNTRLFVLEDIVRET